MTLDYTIADRPTAKLPPSATLTPPPELNDLANTLHSGGALRIDCHGKTDTEVLRMQTRLTGYTRRFNVPFSVQTQRVRTEDGLVLYAWAIPPRTPRGPRTNGKDR